MELDLGRPSAKTEPAAITDVSTATFEADVIRLSMEVPVIVDFWAEWCGPCKQLAPALEKAVAAQKGKVRLAKVDIDRNPELAQALRIQSIPTVFAFFQGRPIDAFQGALPESQVKQFVDRLAQQAGGNDEGLQAILDQAKEALEAGMVDDAVGIYRAVLDEEPELPAALGGLAKALVAKEAFEEAEAVLKSVPASLANNTDIAQARSALELARQAADAGPLGPLTEAVEHNPDDHQARYDLAMALYAAGQAKEAIDHLVESVRRDRTWNEEQARKQLLKFFEALGPKDPVTLAGRRRLSSILFS